MVKRAFDIVFSFLGLAVSIPLFIVFSMWIRMDSPGLVFYRGLRVGRWGRPFRIYKFRTMVTDAERSGGSSTAADDRRVTRVGKFLRRHKLDELPQLINVLKGEMSFVGPRAQVPWAVELYSTDEKMLLNVRPGITDYASIRFRNEADILRGSLDPDKDYLEKIAPEKIRLGLEYLRHHNLWIDVKIITATLWALAGGDPEKILTMPRSLNCVAETSNHPEVV